MLSRKEEDEISAELGRYERRSALCIEALRVVQRHRGWVSDEALRDVAHFLQLTQAEVEAVATFYNLIFRKPVGRHVVFVCDSVSCWVMGCGSVLQQLRDRLGIGPGESTPDGAVTVVPIACLGRCERAPALLVDGEPVVNVTPQALDELIERLTKEAA